MFKEKEEKSKTQLIDILPITFTSLCLISQIILVFTIWGNYYDYDYLVYIGYGIWGLSIIFGILPIFTFKRKGGVGKWESYIKTKVLVTSGVYSIVRHPQFLAGILLSLACALLSQHWVVILLFIPPLIGTYIDALRADKSLIEKFGDEYKRYMKKVPRLDLFNGALRLIIRKIKRTI